MDNENEGKKIEGVEPEKEGVENEFLPPEQKVYCLRNPPTINYNNGTVNRLSMNWNNLIVVSNAFQNVANAYVNAVNDITNFIEPTQPNKTITNKTITTQ